MWWSLIASCRCPREPPFVEAARRLADHGCRADVVVHQAAQDCKTVVWNGLLGDRFLSSREAQALARVAKLTPSPSWRRRDRSDRSGRLAGSSTTSRPAARFWSSEASAGGGAGGQAAWSRVFRA
jgi:hypothetical protein